MHDIAETRRLLRAGHFAEALRQLDAVHIERGTRRTVELIRAELLERLGRHGQCRALVYQLLNSEGLDTSDRSVCELILGRLKWDDGEIKAAIGHFQHSASLAAQAGDLLRMCWSQLWLWQSIAAHSGQDMARPQLSELRGNAIKLGDPHVLVAIHLFLAKAEVRRGLLVTAESHTRMAERLLQGEPNAWLQGLAANVRAAIAIVRGDSQAGLPHAHLAVKYADESGVAMLMRAGLGNLGNLYYLAGEFERADDYFDRSRRAAASNGENSHAGVETMAKVRLLQGELEACAQLLDTIDQAVRSPKDYCLYVYRCARLTRAHLLMRKGALTEALSGANAVIKIATLTGDHLLHDLAMITKAEALYRIGSVAEAVEIMDGISGNLRAHPPDLYAQYERVLGRALAAAGQLDAAQSHFDRARRVYESIRSAPGLLELSRAWDEARSAPPGPERLAAPVEPAPPPPSAAQHLLQGIAALLLHAGRPELLAREIVHLIGNAGCTTGVAALSSADDGSIEVLAASPGANLVALQRAAAWRASIGIARERRVEIVADARPDIESHAALNAIRLLLSTIAEIEQARADREERVSLWPMHDEDGEMGYAIANGRMRELMTLAKRIANTNVSVLLTGESGTGKEILARAIHHFSERAQRPFIPFNCTAVPREMMDSQLFGYRRGAFTGADRDHPGVIRSARDGTLFLDEIGEMGMELQPKLLRFLESGEICPLGESTPLTVNVRVVAATNADLEQLVRDGRFREDLFYRLNVVRLRVPPLRERRDEIPSLVNEFAARSAVEFKKGNVRVSEETMEHLLLYRWPGNIRQLQNELRRIVALAEPNSIISPEKLSEEVVNPALKHAAQARANGTELVVPLNDKLVPTVSRVEREMIRLALREHHGRVEAAAKALGISRKGLYLKRQRLGL